jgi:hypothetical protein
MSRGIKNLEPSLSNGKICKGLNFAFSGGEVFASVELSFLGHRIVNLDGSLEKTSKKLQLIRLPTNLSDRHYTILHLLFLFCVASSLHKAWQSSCLLSQKEKEN